MALALVQATDIDGTVAGTTGVSKAFATNPTPGNMIVCMSLTTISSAGTCTFTDTYGSTINVAGNTGTLVTGSSITIAILAGVIHSGSGTDTVTAKWTGSGTGYVHLVIAEFSGVAGGTVTGNGYASANSAENTSPFNGAALTTTQAGAVLLEYMASNGTGGANTPWSVLASPPTGGNASGYQANKAAGTYTNSFTDTSTGANDPNAIAAYYIVGGSSALTISVSDSVTTSESVSVVKPAPALTVNVSDSVSHTETVSAVEPNALAISTTQSVTTGETVGRTLADNVSVSDSTATSEWIVVAFDPATIFTLEVNVSDSVTTSESVSATRTIATPTINVTDSVSVSETKSVTPLSLNGSVTESVSASDSPTLQPLTLNSSVSESIGVSESTTATPLALQIAVSDSTTTSESVSVSRQASGVLSISVSDSVSVSENVTASLPAALKVAVSDATTTSESHSVSFGFVPDIDLPTTFVLNANATSLAIKADPVAGTIKANNVTGSIKADAVTFAIKPDKAMLAIKPEATSHAIDGDTT